MVVVHLRAKEYDTKDGDHAVVHLQVITEKRHHYKTLKQCQLIHHIVSTRIEILIFLYDLHAHVDNPEALIVGVVGDCPTEFFLSVQQPVGTSRSGDWKLKGQQTSS